jgi:hypothetical protein
MTARRFIPMQVCTRSYYVGFGQTRRSVVLFGKKISSDITGDGQSDDECDSDEELKTTLAMFDSREEEHSQISSTDVLQSSSCGNGVIDDRDAELDNKEGAEDEELQDTLSMFPGRVTLDDGDSDDDDEQLQHTLSMFPGHVKQAADDIEGAEEMQDTPHEDNDDRDSEELQDRLLSFFSTNLSDDDSGDSDNESIADEEWAYLENEFAGVRHGEFAILN